MARQGSHLKYGSLHLGVLGLIVSLSFLQWHRILIAVTTLEKCPCTWRVSSQAEFPTPAWSRRFRVREIRYLCKAMSVVDASFVTKPFHPWFTEQKALTAVPSTLGSQSRMHWRQCLPIHIHRSHTRTCYSKIQALVDSSWFSNAKSQKLCVLFLLLSASLILYSQNCTKRLGTLT